MHLPPYDKNNLLKNPKVPFFLLGIFTLIFSMFLRLNLGDDVYFLDVVNHTAFKDFIWMRYNTWTSRVVIEVFLYFFAKHTLLWRVVNGLMYPLLAWSLWRLLPKSGRIPSTAWLSVLGVILLPIEMYFSAGWVTTNVHYFFMVTIGAFSIIPLRILSEGDSLRWYHCLVFLPALIYGTNNEQMAVATLILYGGAILYFGSRRKLHPYTLIALGITLTNMVLMLFNPGNAARGRAEIANWYPDFPTTPFFQKISIAFASTTWQYLLNLDVLFLCFILIVAYAVYRKPKDLLARVAVAVPLIVITLSGVFYKFLLSIQSLGQGTGIFETLKDLRKPSISYDSHLGFVLVILSTLSIIYGLWSLYGKSATFASILWVLGAGFATRMLMALSPTILASGLRTFFILYACILYAALRVFMETRQKTDQTT